MNRRLPVTLVGGFLGAGKTSLLHHAISTHQGGHLAILVESPASLNLDARALGGLCGAMRREYDAVLEIPAEDDAAQVEWIAARLREWSLAGRYERILVEVGGMTNAARLARHFGLQPGHSDKFSPWAELQQIVCVVDALDFFRGSRSPSPGTLSDFQREQISSASLIVLNKCDLLEVPDRLTCARLVRLLNPEARIAEASFGELPPEAWLIPAPERELGLASERRLRPASVGVMELVRPSWASVLYRAHRPFHPQRFWDWFNGDQPGLLRMKGLVWLATRNLLVGGVSCTRWQNSCGVAGIWWAALPREDWPQDPETLTKMQQTWREPFGDRRQELVLIGDIASLAGVRWQLDACLLSAEEYALPPAEWSLLPDPFPEWSLEESTS